jgi:hypothetical protein
MQQGTDYDTTDTQDAGFAPMHLRSTDVCNKVLWLDILLYWKEKAAMLTCSVSSRNNFH